MKNTEIQQAANNIRKHVLKLTIEKGGNYLSQACSSAEILASLYLEILNLSKCEVPDLMPGLFPGAPSRQNMDYLKGSTFHGSTKAPYDRFFVSPAHYASTLYSALIEAGRLNEKALEQFNSDGFAMEMIGANHTPGFETAAGTLAQTISTACGVAHARKMRNEPGKIVVFMSDGEMQEGQVWEALQTASHYKLDNVIVYIDINGRQVEGTTESNMNIEPLDKRVESFGATSLTINGNNIDQLLDSVNH